MTADAPQVAVEPQVVLRLPPVHTGQPRNLPCAPRLLAGNDESRVVSFHEERTTQIAMFKKAVSSALGSGRVVVGGTGQGSGVGFVESGWGPAMQHPSASGRVHTSPLRQVAMQLAQNSSAFRFSPRTLLFATLTSPPHHNTCVQVAMLLEEYYNSGDLNEAAVSLQVRCWGVGQGRAEQAVGLSSSGSAGPCTALAARCAAKRALASFSRH